MILDELKQYFSRDGNMCDINFDLSYNDHLYQPFIKIISDIIDNFHKNHHTDNIIKNKYRRDQCSMENLYDLFGQTLLIQTILLYQYGKK